MLVLPKAALIMSLQLSEFFAQVVKLRGVVQRDELCSHRPLLALRNVCCSQHSCTGTTRHIRAVHGAALTLWWEERYRKIENKPRITLQSLLAYPPKRSLIVVESWVAEVAGPFFSRCCSVWRERQPPWDSFGGG